MILQYWMEAIACKIASAELDDPNYILFGTRTRVLARFSVNSSVVHLERVLLVPCRSSIIRWGYL
jgi:hypothetical protein